MSSQRAFRFYKDQRTELAPVGNSPTITWAPQLVFAAGYFAYNTPVYDLTQPGLYAFTHYATAAENWNNTTHMIVHDGDHVALLSAAAWLSAFGDGDDALTVAQKSAKARSSVLNVLCGPLHTWAKAELLDPHGVTSRVVQFITMETPNNYVDGHQALEVTIDGNRVLADLSNNCLFHDLSANRLSADAAVAALAADTFAYEALASDGYTSEASSGFDAAAYARTHLATDADRRAWHRRIFQAIGMVNGSEVWWKLPAGSEDRASWVEGLQSSYKVKSAAVWDATFYPA